MVHAEYVCMPTIQIDVGTCHEATYASMSYTLTIQSIDVLVAILCNVSATARMHLLRKNLHHMVQDR